MSYHNLDFSIIIIIWHNSHLLTLLWLSIYNNYFSIDFLLHSALWTCDHLKINQDFRLHYNKYFSIMCLLSQVAETTITFRLLLFIRWTVSLHMGFWKVANHPLYTTICWLFSLLMPKREIESRVCCLLLLGG